jgi:hypothetical protein
VVPLATPHYMRSTPANSIASESGAFVYRDQQSSRDGIELTGHVFIKLAHVGAAVVALHEDPKKWNQVSYRVSQRD